MDESERQQTVRRIARSGDPDRALSVLFAPREARKDLFALYALNVELARVAEQVSEPALGAVRLQWWREALDRAEKGESTGHPVADAFGATLRRRKLSRRLIDALINARGLDVAREIMPGWSALEGYLRDTAAALFDLSLECLGEASAPGATLQAGRAYGLTGLMRALPLHASQGRIYLPQDALLRHGTSPDAVLAGKTSSGLAVVLGEMRGKAQTALAEARHEIARLERPRRTAFLPLALVEPYLAALEKASRDPLHEVAEINPLYRLWRLARWEP